MRSLLFCCLAALLVFQQVLAIEGQALKRRKLRRKVVKPTVHHQDELEDDDDRDGRGFLDDYYSQFEERVSESLVDHRQGSSAASFDSDASSTNARMDHAYATGYEDSVPRHMPAHDDDHDYSVIQEMQLQALRQKQVKQLEQALQQKHLEEQLLEEELTLLRKKKKSQLEHNYVQQVALPHGMPDDKAYMYSSVMNAEDDDTNDILPAKSVANYVYRQPDSYAEDKLYSSSGSSMDYSRLFSGSPDSSSYYGDTSAGSSSTDPVSRFFGLTGTTSQDIQLGLTFTVPFLSVPLTSLQSALGGDGLSGLFDSEFDVGSLVIIGIIIVAAIFVLPQVIYWATGVNLSAFNWGRMDDGHGLNVASMMNLIEDSLKKYDVDTRSCLSRTMCNQYAQRVLEGEEEAVQRISRGLIENIAQHDYVKKYLGESKVQEALDNGAKGKDCSIYYSRDVCPWDTTAMIKIASKIVSSGNVDFASIASAAAANLMKN